MRKPWTLLGAALVAGCVAPPMVTVATLALDGMSFATTGKSVTDHALSLVVQRDCAVWRVIAERSVAALCRLDGVLAVADDPALARPRGDGAWIATPVRSLAPVGAPPVLADAAAVPRRNLAPAQPRLFLATASTGPTLAEERPATFLVVGSFRKLTNARAMRAQVADVGAAVATAVVDGRLRYRVVVGPLARDDLGAVRDRLGIADAWPLRLCPASLVPPPCRGDPIRLTLLEDRP